MPFGRFGPVVQWNVHSETPLSKDDVLVMTARKEEAPKMRWLLVLLLGAVGAVIANLQPAAAQSAYSYPICLEYGIGGGRSCYYSNYQQCRYDARTWTGAVCVPNPFYRGNAYGSPRASAYPSDRRR